MPGAGGRDPDPPDRGSAAGSGSGSNVPATEMKRRDLGGWGAVPVDPTSLGARIVPILAVCIAAVFCSPVGVGAPAVHPAAPVQGHWTNLFPRASPAGPGPLGAAGLVWDAADGYLLLFGGARATYGTYLGGETNATWAYNGSWTNRTATAGPAPPARGAEGDMAYDAADHEVVLFAGSSGNGSPLSDTWTFSGGRWSPVANTTGGPAARAFPSMTYDGALRAVVLFGGLASNGTPLNDTWTFAAGVWTRVSSSGAPSVRWGAQFAYDPAMKADILFGGLNRQGMPVAVTWAFHRGNWTRLNGSAPGARWGGAFGYDAGHRGLVLFGGCLYYSCGSVVYSDTWLFQNGSWRNSSTAFHLTRSPPGLGDVGGAYDPVDHRFVIYGGMSLNASVPSRATWGLDRSWVNLLPVAPWPGPGPLGGAGLVYDAADGYLLLFGGEVSGRNASHMRNGTWSFNGSWTDRTGTVGPAPSPRVTQGSMAYDPTDHEVVLFGGESNAGGGLNDTWTYSGGRWSQVVNLSTSPNARVFADLAYDNQTGSVILFGGSSDIQIAHGGFSTRTWSFAHGAWSPINTSATPSPRRGAVMAYDPALQGLVLFGGMSFGGVALSDTWLFHNGTWTRLNGSGPPARFLGVLDYDPQYQEMVLYGGCSFKGCVTTRGDTWFLQNRHWVSGSSANLTSNPSPRGALTGAYDPVTHQLVMYGGHPTLTFPFTSSSYYCAATWAFV